MTETTDLSNFASKANAVYNCVTSNATAVTAFSVAGNVCACVVCGPTVCATTSVCSPIVCATSCVSAASICATNLYGNGAGLTGLSAGVITVCSGAVTCCSSGCLNYACGNYFKIRLNGDYNLCCLQNATSATDLYLDVVSNLPNMSIKANTSFLQTGGSLNNFPPNTKKIYHYSKVGSKYFGRGWVTSTSEVFDTFNGNNGDKRYVINDTASCSCSTSDLFACMSSANNCFNAVMALKSCGYYPFIITCQMVCQATFGCLRNVQYNCPGWYCAFNRAVLLKYNGQYITIAAVVGMTNPGGDNPTTYTPMYLPILHDLEFNCGKSCLCSCFNSVVCACTSAYKIACLSGVTGGSTGVLRIISHSINDDIILTYVPYCCCCGGFVVVDKLSCVIAGKTGNELQRICICGFCCVGCQDWSIVTPYHNFDCTSIPASLWKVSCRCEPACCLSLTKYKFWKGTTACPVCYSCCGFTICDCGSYPCTLWNGSSMFNTEICGKYLLIGGTSRNCGNMYAYNWLKDECYCSCTTFSISSICCLQRDGGIGCGRSSYAYVTADEYLCHLVHFTKTNCAGTASYYDIWTRVSDTIVNSYSVYGTWGYLCSDGEGGCINVVANCPISCGDPRCFLTRISVWECCIYSNAFYCATCVTCPCGAYGLKYCSTTCTWSRNTADLFCASTAGYCGNLNLMGDTYHHLLDLSNNNVDFMSVKMLSNTELCAID